MVGIYIEREGTNIVQYVPMMIGDTSDTTYAKQTHNMMMKLGLLYI